jgi:2-succinyl-6-hydroxy-2,4-cyclohexadiene-1-carboxylate synthase
VLDDLATDHEVCRVDAPGHGRARRSTPGCAPARGSSPTRAATATYLGYSMGARFLLHLALSNPELVRGLVLIGAQAASTTRRAGARAERDEAMAHGSSELGLERVPRRVAGAAAVRRPWAPRSSSVPSAGEHRRGLAESCAGRHGRQDPLWDRLHRWRCRCSWSPASSTTKFSAEAQRLGESIGANATVALVPGAGHAAHLEQPDAFLAILRPWLAEHDL